MLSFMCSFLVLGSLSRPVMRTHVYTYQTKEDSCLHVPDQRWGLVSTHPRPVMRTRVYMYQPTDEDLCLHVPENGFRSTLADAANTFLTALWSSFLACQTSPKMMAASKTNITLWYFKKKYINQVPKLIAKNIKKAKKRKTCDLLKWLLKASIYYGNRMLWAPGQGQWENVKRMRTAL